MTEDGSWRSALLHGLRVGGIFAVVILAVALLLVGLLALAHIIGT